MPPLYLALNIATTIILVHTVRVIAIIDPLLDYLGYLQLPSLAVVTILFYLLASYLNPGYIIGNEEVQLAKAQDYDLRHKRSKSRQEGMHGGEDGQQVLTGSLISSVASS